MCGKTHMLFMLFSHMSLFIQKLKAVMTKVKGDNRHEIIVSLIAKYTDELIQNPFGNYAI